MEQLKEKALRLVSYLRELSRLRSKITRDIREYNKVLWLHEIPKDNKYCFSLEYEKAEENDPDIWVEISKYNEPNLGELPDEFLDWIDNSKLHDTSDIPELFQTIKVGKNGQQSENRYQKEPFQIEELKNNPELINKWEKYIDSTWLPWAEEHKSWEKVANVYGKLFEIRTEQQKLGEEYELVIGFGLLSWNTPSSQKIRRHVIVSKANLNFEPKLGKFTITPPTDGAQISAEFDMLDFEDQPVNIKQLIQEGIESLNDNPWDKINIENVIKTISNLLSDQGQAQYYNNLKPQENIEKHKPVIEYAPAIILRKRSVKGLELTLNNIQEQIEEEIELPKEFIDICEGNANRNIQLKNGIDNLSSTDPTIYFPKPYNERQLEIINKLNQTTGVLVQGPPGTGKSHTIANLICHLLANGQRVLVTAKTPRALQVLHNLLPESIKPLCINLLGSGLEEQRSLEVSVSNILSKQDYWNDTNEQSKIEELKNDIHGLKKEKTKVENHIRSIRESETYKHNIIDGSFEGTAAKIALQIKKDAEEFNWFEDKINHDQIIPLSSEQIISLFNRLDLLDTETKDELNLDLPDLEKFITVEEFKNLVSKESNLISKLNSLKSNINSFWIETIKKANQLEINSIVQSITNLNTLVENIIKRPMPWILEAVEEMLTDNDTPWKERLKTLNDRLKGLSEKAKKHSDDVLNLPKEIHRKKVLYDSKKLLDYFNKGGKPSWWFLKPKSVKSLKYICKEVKVNGNLCDNSTDLQQLINNLEIREDIDYCWKVWDKKFPKKPGTDVLQIAELEESQEALQIVVSIYDLLEESKLKIKKIDGLTEPHWHHKDSLKEFINSCDYVLITLELNEIKSEFESLLNNIELDSIKNYHSLTSNLLDSIKTRDIESYSSIIKEFSEIKQKKNNLLEIRSILSKLSDYAPNLVNKLLASPTNPKWNIKLNNLHKAWNWSRANSWFDNFLNSEDTQSLERRRNQIDDIITSKLTELTASLSWSFCFSRMQEQHRRHLMVWQQSIKRIGKGTGKYAPKHRRDAQYHLNECKEAVPAWIMPLYRVYETVHTEPETFDVVIIDESSQCGPEALPLTYLTKKLIVVGDDQQISPEAVGITRSQVHKLMNEYLYDFRHADSFDVENSIFDHCKRRFNNRIVLQEHFRCMPEIIGFSNDLCYSDTPLIPLRIPNKERLDPIKYTYLSEGYREGSSSNVQNLVEAEQIVETIIECCNDPKYAGKSMGVISLQGDAQAHIIESLLIEKLGIEEIERRNIICGNPYTFQGDERDVIFLSMVAAPNERIGTLSRAPDQRRFNVATSRARDQMWLFHSVTLNDLSEFGLRRKLLEYFQNPKTRAYSALGSDADELRLALHRANKSLEKPPNPFDSWFEVEVALKIADQGFRIIPQFELAGKRIDLFVESSKSKLAIECDGDNWHGIDNYEKDTERQRILERCGLKFFRIRESMFNANTDKALSELWEELKYLGIKPIGES